MDSPGVLDVILLVGFTARLTRLVTVDDILEPVRVGILYRVPARVTSATASLLSCPFCIGFWLSLAVLASWVAWGSTWGWMFVAGTFTLNYVHAHLNARLDAETDR